MSAIMRRRKRAFRKYGLVFSRAGMNKSISAPTAETSNGWRVIPLGELTENHDAQRIPVKERDRKPGAYPYYGASGIVDHVDQYIFDGEYLLIAEDGENLRTCQTPIAFLARGRFWVNNHAHIVRGNSEADTRFLMYALRNADIGGYLTGSTMPKLTQGNMNRIPILAPPLSEQRAIAGVLGALDDKIELNRRMNETLEAIAQAEFRRMMEEGGVSTVGDEFDLTMGQSPPGNTYNETGDGIPFFQGRIDFGFRYPTERVFCTAPTRFANTGDTLVSVRAPVGSVNMAAGKCCVGRGVAAVRHKSGSRSYTYYFMRSLEPEFARFEAEGTVFGSINKDGFQGLECLAPPVEAIAAFEKFAFPIDQKIENNENESRTLTTIRDALLPKLLSGAVRVKVTQ